MTTRINTFPLAIIVLILLYFGVWLRQRNELTPYSLDYIKGSISPYLDLDRPSFYEIAKAQKTDKVTNHHYEKIYEHLLAPIRDKPIRLLEIGLGCDSVHGPGTSLNLWQLYFPILTLYIIETNASCVDSFKNTQPASEEVTFYIGDQADPKFLDDVIRKSGGEFDVIVDAGGHRMVQQGNSLHTLFHSLTPHGIYFIEDLSTSYQALYGGSPDREATGTLMYDLKVLWDDVNAYYEGSSSGGVGVGEEGNEGGGKTRGRVFPWSKEVERVEFVRDCVAIVRVGEEEVVRD